jgi:5'-3' exonuclease
MCARLFVLDGPGYLFRAYHALPYLSTSKGVPVNTVLGMSTMLWKLFREERPDYFAVAWDPPGPTFRDEKFSAYKETRAATPDDLKRQIPFVMQVLAALRVPVLEVAGFEADDVLGTMVDRARAHDVDVVLVTQDKDMLQLVGPRVTVLAPGAKAGEQIVYDADRVREKWGVGPEQIPDLLALMGDSIDNIPGVPGIGQKTAVKLIGQFGSVEGLYQHLSLVPGKLRETLAANRKQALLSRELATGEHAGAAVGRSRGAAPRGARLGEAPLGVDRARAAEPPAPAPGVGHADAGGRGRGAGRRRGRAGDLPRESARRRAARGGLGRGERAPRSRDHPRRASTIPPPATCR